MAADTAVCKHHTKTRGMVKGVQHKSKTSYNIKNGIPGNEWVF